MTSQAKTVDEYLENLPEERRVAIETVAEFVRKHLPQGYEEGIQYGMICWHVPHEIFPPGYHCDPKQPLPFLALASQKHYMALYLSRVYEETGEAGWFEREYAEAGKKLDMGKSCLRFKSVDDLALEVIGKAIACSPVEKFVAHYVQSIPASKRR